MKMNNSIPQNIGEMLSHSHSIEKEQNGRLLIIIIESLHYLGRPGIAMRGHDDYESNFIQLLKLRSSDNKVSFNSAVGNMLEIVKIFVYLHIQELIDWLKRKADKYTSGEIQNEILKIMVCQVLLAVIKNVKEAGYYSIIVDECVDSWNKEQLVICFR